MQQNGLGKYTQCVVQGAREDWQHDADSMEQLLEMNPTAVVCFNDSLALRFWDVACTKGLRVPQDLSIIGVDGRPEAVARRLSTISHSFFHVGRLATESWIELCNGASYQECCKVTPFTLIEGCSVSAAAT
jgi:DNA-binding LacI/PurR family transcriptional regulator